MAAMGPGLSWEPALPANVGAAHGRDGSRVIVGAGPAGECWSGPWPRLNSVPQSEPAFPVPDTFKTSLCTNQLFPTA